MIGEISLDPRFRGGERRRKCSAVMAGTSPGMTEWLVVRLQHTPVIRGRRHSASKTRVNALMAPDPESRRTLIARFWIPGSRFQRAPE